MSNYNRFIQRIRKIYPENERVKDRTKEGSKEVLKKDKEK